MYSLDFPLLKEKIFGSVPLTMDSLAKPGDRRTLSFRIGMIEAYFITKPVFSTIRKQRISRALLLASWVGITETATDDNCLRKLCGVLKTLPQGAQLTESMRNLLIKCLLRECVNQLPQSSL